MKIQNVNQTTSILVVGIFISVFHNMAFFRHIADFYSLADNLTVILISTGILHAGIIIILLSLFGVGRFLKIVLALILIISSATAYFIDNFNVIIDQEMLINVIETNPDEAFDLFTVRLLVYFVLLGLLPAAWVYTIHFTDKSVKMALMKRVALVLASVLVMLIVIFSQSDFYASFFREQKQLKSYANPTKALESVYKLAETAIGRNRQETWQHVANDARKPDKDDELELVVLVIGETARAENFSVNGYKRKTNPKLEMQKITSFTNVASCGTTTAVSVPCMFSFQDRNNYDRGKAASMDNVLDVLKRSGVEILWRDNNSGSKGVADRVAYQSFQNPDINPVCDIECRDEGMLSGLDEWLMQHDKSDILIVLHQLGSHGPAYYKRYPPQYEKFKPTCQTNQLDECTSQQILNAYDNTILYTDYFLDKVINWLESKDKHYEVSMLYVSDHGESLGESGLYLHGFPYAIAPDGQTRVPAILWGGQGNSDIDFEKVRSNRANQISHDNLAQTLLGLFEVQSEFYRADKDILKYQYRYD